MKKVIFGIVVGVIASLGWLVYITWTAVERGILVKNETKEETEEAA